MNILAHVFRTSFLVALTTVSFGLALSGCPEGQCDVNSDCEGDGICRGGLCLPCVENGDCDGDQLCCGGDCYEESTPEAQCGCDPEGEGAGDTCSGGDNVCLVSSTRANADNLADGTCGCDCTPIQGGSLCTIDEEAAAGYTCGCDTTDDVGTCGGASIGPDNLPHVTADTCGANGCVCLSENAPCGTGGLDGDCSAGACVDLVGDDGNCGVAAVDCSEPTTGLDDGTGVCVDGGCNCDAPEDCGGNTDICAVATGGNVCVCSDYEVGGTAAACPMGLACVQGGCDFNGTIVATDVALFAAAGLPAAE